MITNRLQTVWIFARCAWLMTRVTMQGVIHSLFGRLDRQKVDRILQTWAKDMLDCLQVQVTLDVPPGFTLPANKPIVFMANHSSLFDIPLVYATLTLSSIRMVGKKELFNIPLFGRAMRAAEIPSIDRHNKARAIADLEKAKTTLRSGIAIWFFPEGTRSPDGQLLPLKKGGFIFSIQTGATIIPIGIRGAQHILPKKTWAFHLGQTASLHLGDPIDAGQYTLDNKELLIEKVTASLQQLLQQ